MGHNFGLEHANWNYIKEYGDDYDVMGNSPLDESVLEFPYNAAYRVALGWIPPARVAWATFPADRQIIADLVPCTDYSDPFKTSIQAIVVTMDEGRETLVVSARLLKDGSIGAVLRLLPPFEKNNASFVNLVVGPSQIIDATDNGKVTQSQHLMYFSARILPLPFAICFLM